MDIDFLAECRGTVNETTQRPFGSPFRVFPLVIATFDVDQLYLRREAERQYLTDVNFLEQSEVEK